MFWELFGLKKMQDFGDGLGPVPYKIHPRGGGRISEAAQVAESADICAESSVSGDAAVGARSTLRRSQASAGAFIGENALLQDVHVGSGTIIGEGCTVIGAPRSKRVFVRDLTLEDGSGAHLSGLENFGSCVAERNVTLLGNISIKTRVLVTGQSDQPLTIVNGTLGGVANKGEIRINGGGRYEDCNIGPGVRIKGDLHLKNCEVHRDSSITVFRGENDEIPMIEGNSFNVHGTYEIIKEGGQWRMRDVNLLPDSELGRQGAAYHGRSFNPQLNLDFAAKARSR